MHHDNLVSHHQQGDTAVVPVTLPDDGGMVAAAGLRQPDFPGSYLAEDLSVLHQHRGFGSTCPYILCAATLFEMCVDDLRHVDGGYPRPLLPMFFELIGRARDCGAHCHVPPTLHASIDDTEAVRTGSHLWSSSAQTGAQNTSSSSAARNIAASDMKGVFPLHDAVLQNHQQCAASILFDCDRHAKVMSTSSFTSSSPSLSRGASVPTDVVVPTERLRMLSIRDAQGLTPLHVAAREGLAAMAGMLLQAGADITATAHRGWTVFHYAAVSRSADLCRTLMAHCHQTVTMMRPSTPEAQETHTQRVTVEEFGDRTTSSVTSESSDSESDGGAAAVQSSNDRGGAMLLMKPLVNALTDRRETPLYRAAEWGCSETCATLVAAGACVMTANLVGWTPLHIAARNGYAEAITTIVNLFSKQQQQQQSCGRTSPAMSQRSSTPKLSPSQPADDGSGECGSSHCSNCNHLRHIVDCCDKDCWTALRHASEHSRVKAVTALVSLGADIEAVDRRRMTALHAAARLGHLAVCKALLDAGANVHAQDTHGATPLQLAHVNNRLDTAALLLQHT